MKTMQMIAEYKPARNVHPLPVSQAAQSILRDIAFVLKMTRKVKRQLLAERVALRKHG